VAHDVSARCREVLGGSGSLMLTSDVIGQMPGASTADGGRPFTIGQVDPTKGFVHVFDDTALDTVMGTLDTIADFTMYLTRKEQFFQGGLRVMAAGEDDLLAYYLHGINAAGEHD